MMQISNHYKTKFVGHFVLDKALQPAHAAYLHAFSKARHMRWNMERIAAIPDPIREAVDLPLGDNGAYFVAAGDDASADSLADQPYAETQGLPNLYCDWQPTADAYGIEWNRQTNTYFYADWLEYLIVHFLKRWGYVLNGEVCWQGDDPADSGVLKVTDNLVKAVPNKPRPSNPLDFLFSLTDT